MLENVIVTIFILKEERNKHSLSGIFPLSHFIQSNFFDILILTNNSNDITRNLNLFVGCSETSLSVTVKHIQHVGIIRAFYLLGVC